jgi:hypothetical protein
VPDVPTSTYCRNRGEKPPSDFASPIPDVAAELTLWWGQYAVVFLAIRDGGWLHIAVQNAPTMVTCSETHYGPLASCPRHEWTRVADIDIGDARLSELVEDRGRPFDCKQQHCWLP